MRKEHGDRYSHRVESIFGPLDNILFGRWVLLILFSKLRRPSRHRDMKNKEPAHAPERKYQAICLVRQIWLWSILHGPLVYLVLAANSPTLLLRYGCTFESEFNRYSVKLGMRTLSE